MNAPIRFIEIPNLISAMSLQTNARVVLLTQDFCRSLPCRKIGSGVWTLSTGHFYSGLSCESATHERSGLKTERSNRFILQGLKTSPSKLQC